MNKPSTRMICLFVALVTATAITGVAILPKGYDITVFSKEGQVIATDHAKPNSTTSRIRSVKLPAFCPGATAAAGVPDGWSVEIDRSWWGLLEVTAGRMAIDPVGSGRADPCAPAFSTSSRHARMFLSKGARERIGPVKGMLFEIKATD